jgi:hypothetical protein
MSILDKLHNIIDADVAKLFSAAKKTSVLASTRVQQLEAELESAKEEAIRAAQEVQQHAEAAAAQAKKAAEELAIEARAAAEKVALHTSQLTDRVEPKL